MRKILAGKTASLSPYLSGITEGLSGGSTTKDVETLLQMVYLSFEKHRFDKQSYQLLKQKLSNGLLSRSKNISAKMQDKTTEILYGRTIPEYDFLIKNSLMIFPLIK